MPSSLPSWVCVCVDVTCIALAAASTWLASATDAAIPVPEAALLATAFAAVWLLASRHFGLYRVPSSRNLGLAMRHMVETWSVTWGIAGLVMLSLVAMPTIAIWLLLVSGLTLLSLARLAFVVVPTRIGAGRHRAVIVGSCASARALAERRSQMDIEIVGVVPFSGENLAAMPHLRPLGSLDELPRILRQNAIDVALVSPSDAALTGEVHRVFHVCDELGLGVRYFPSFLDVAHLQIGLTWSDDRPGLFVHSHPVPSFARFLKRSIDVVGALAGIVVLLPVFVTCALAVVLTSRGPVLFGQTRVGESGRRFQCLKFRTMTVGADAQRNGLRGASSQDGPAFKMPGDPRVTPIGRLLRKFSLDELPQLFNVLLGDMSLVGPRPPIPDEVDVYTWWQRRRIAVKPGLTCVWQVWGRNRVSFKRWVEMDLYYIDNWSLWMDVKLIVHTFGVVLRGTGM